MVIRNITVIGGLSVHLFPLARFFFFFDTGECYRAKLLRQPIKGAFLSLAADKRAINTVAMVGT